MFLTKHFVFLHFPKTGGSFVRTLLSEHAPADWELQVLSLHPTIRDIPASHENLPVFGYVRNPFDWYVSWYSFLKSEGDNAFFNEVSDSGRKGFKDTLLSIFALDIPGRLGTECRFRGSTFGCYLNHHFGNDLSLLRLGRFENLREDLLAILAEWVEIPERLVEAVRARPPINISQRNHYRDYYDDELRAIVARRDKEVLGSFGYRF